MVRNLLALAVLVCSVAPGWAGEDPKKPEPGSTVEMPFLVAPMTKDGNLLGYAYISSKLVCSSPNACIAVREKLAFIQDLNVRDVNARPVSLPDDPTAVDKDQLNTRLTDNARRIVGADKVKSTKFEQIQYVAIHPSESTEGAAPPAQQSAPADAATPASQPSPTPQKPGTAAATSKQAAKQPQ